MVNNIAEVADFEYISRSRWGKQSPGRRRARFYQNEGNSVYLDKVLRMVLWVANY